MKICIYWFRRDLRLNDNHGFSEALNSGYPVIPLFIFDDDILGELDRDDARVSFIHEELAKMNSELVSRGSGLLVLKGKPLEVWNQLIANYDLAEAHCNGDYEPYALQRDEEVSSLLKSSGSILHAHKDQVIFEKDEVLKDDGGFYTVYTPYSKKWFSLFDPAMLKAHPSAERLDGLHQFTIQSEFPSLAQIGFEQSEIKVRPYVLEQSRILDYENTRNLPAIKGTSDLSPHLRFGTISCRQAMAETYQVNHTFAKELVWREFFMQVLFHRPEVVKHNFKRKYDAIPWRNNEDEFERWCAGQTGYAFVDAGMRELNESGYMHNRVRMIVAGFLCKHLLIDWRWGEAYFAKKLLDYELSSNNGNWQWAAGTGCDAAPYFRVFNPISQIDKFDPDRTYIRKWVPEFESPNYPEMMVDHKMARNRAIARYKAALS
jgi:deoxyribodipyrimidine photo-lyase